MASLYPKTGVKPVPEGQAPRIGLLAGPWHVS